VGAPCPTPASALPFCGIGDPDLFQDDLRAAGCNTAGFRVFRDHHPYTLSRWEALMAEAKALGVPLVTTDKDLSRVQAAAGASLARAPLLVLRIETVVWDERVLLEAVRRAAGAHAGGAAR
jgi:tetraacyldisaccharide-1-P 4'-kinase